jgi:RHS repeat-associated protein
VDSTGEVETNYAYDPFGVPVVAGDGSNPYQFTGEAWDAEVELLYLRARYYQPETGRFIAKDPWAGNVWRPGTLNRYVYVTNNPINRRDPSGRQEIEPTATPTEREEQTMQCIEDLAERESWHIAIPLPTSCDIPTVPQQEALPQVSAVNPGIGLVFQRTIVSPEHFVSFWVLYVEETDRGYVWAIGGGDVKSSLEITVKVYMNGTFMDIYDTYDTTDLTSLALALDTPPRLVRSIEVRTNRGTGRGPLPFTNVWRERELFGVRIGPWSIGGGTEQLDPSESAQMGEKGRGHVYARTWFTAEEGLPWSIRMRLTIPELTGGVAAGALGDSPSYGGVGFYDESLGNIYPSH